MQRLHAFCESLLIVICIPASIILEMSGLNTSTKNRDVFLCHENDRKIHPSESQHTKRLRPYA